MGVDGKNGKDPGHLSGQGSAEAHGDTAAMRDRWDVVLPITGRIDEGGRDRSDSDLNTPEEGVPRRCPVEGCPGKLTTRTEMRVHFVHRHVLDTVVMLEEGNFPQPRCARCDMQVPRKALNGRHLGIVRCKKGAERKRRRLAETETRENSERAFKAYREPMEAVS